MPCVPFIRAFYDPCHVKKLNLYHRVSEYFLGKRADEKSAPALTNAAERR